MKDWIIYYCERTGRITKLLMGTVGTMGAKGTVLSSVTGTEEDAEREIERLEKGKYKELTKFYTKKRSTE